MLIFREPLERKAHINLRADKTTPSRHGSGTGHRFTGPIYAGRKVLRFGGEVRNKPWIDT